MKETKRESTARSLCRGLLPTTSTSPNTNQLPINTLTTAPAGGARGVEGFLNICLLVLLNHAHTQYSSTVLLPAADPSPASPNVSAVVNRMGGSRSLLTSVLQFAELRERERERNARRWGMESSHPLLLLLPS